MDPWRAPRSLDQLNPWGVWSVVRLRRWHWPLFGVYRWLQSCTWAPNLYYLPLPHLPFHVPYDALFLKVWILHGGVGPSWAGYEVAWPDPRRWGRNPQSCVLGPWWPPISQKAFAQTPQGKANTSKNPSYLLYLSKCLSYSRPFKMSSLLINVSL